MCDPDPNRNVSEPPHWPAKSSQSILFHLSKENILTKFTLLQNITDPVEMQQIRHADMNHPLAHYWIASSHNTYLTG